MTTAIATTTGNLLEQLGILPQRQSEGGGSGRIKFDKGIYFLLIPGEEKREEIELGHSFRGVLLPQPAYANGIKFPRMGHEFYQGWDAENNSACRSYVDIIDPAGKISESKQGIAYSGWQREKQRDCSACPLVAYGPDGKWKRIKDRKLLADDQQPCGYRGELKVVPDGHAGAYPLQLSYTSLWQLRGDFKDPAKAPTGSKAPTFAALLGQSAEHAQAFVQGRLICEFSSTRIKSDNVQIGTFDVVTVKPIGVTDKSLLVETPTLSAPTDEDAAPWDNE